MMKIIRTLNNSVLVQMKEIKETCLTCESNHTTNHNKKIIVKILNGGKHITLASQKGPNCRF